MGAIDPEGRTRPTAKSPLSPSTAASAPSPRRKRAAARSTPQGRRRPKEKGGRGGLDPARYGDWEIKGLTSDF